MHLLLLLLLLLLAVVVVWLLLPLLLVVMQVLLRGVLLLLRGVQVLRVVLLRRRAASGRAGERGARDGAGGAAHGHRLRCGRRPPDARPKELPRTAARRCSWAMWLPHDRGTLLLQQRVLLRVLL